jgi:tRNA C32,U32 (ribose-2'-O)-methylase TrmJ
VHGAGVYDDVEDALRGCDAAIAFHRWHEGCAPRAVTDVAELLRSFPGDSGGTGGSAAGSGDDGGESTLGSSRRNASEEGVPPPEAVEEWDWSSPAQVAKDAAAAAAAAAFLEGLETPEDKALSHAERERREHGWRRRRHATPPRNRAGRGRKRLALVFGREVEGLFDDEVNQARSRPHWAP